MRKSTKFTRDSGPIPRAKRLRNWFAFCPPCAMCMQNRFPPFRSPCENEPVQLPSLKLCQTLKHIFLQSGNCQYTSSLCGLGIVAMFVPAVATKCAEPPSQPQQQKIDSFGTVSRRLLDKTRPVVVRTNASLPQKRNVDNVTLAEPAKPAVSQPILKKEDHER
jgi:hypothetical protein